ncbi:MAG: class I SAM-dependent methyltransferase [bacterium]
MTTHSQKNSIRTRPAPNCGLCGKQGQRLYESVTDTLCGVPGIWSFRSCENPDCGLLWLDPMPLEDDIINTYKTYFTHTGKSSRRQQLVQFVKAGYMATKYGYSRESVSRLQRLIGLLAYLAIFRRSGLDFLVHHLSALPHGRVLDVGCGDGQILQFMQNLGWVAEGVDFDPVAVENARQKGLRVHAGTLQSLAAPSNSFEAIILSHVIEHVHAPAELLRECHRLIKPRGRLIVLTPNADSWGHRKFQNCWRGLEPPRHLQIFTPQSLRRLAQQAGFEKITLTTTLRNADKILRISRALRRPGSSSNPFARLSVKALQLAEWFAWKRDPDSGEELDLIVEK